MKASLVVKNYKTCKSKLVKFYVDLKVNQKKTECI